MITSVTYPDKYSFVGNPMIVNITGDSEEQIILSISVNGVKISDFSFFLFGDSTAYKGSFNLSRILEQFIKKHTVSQGSIVDEVNNFYVTYSIAIDGYENFDFNGNAFYGGLDDKNYSKLSLWRMNMFTYRLRNPERQFLFTTRTNTSHLILRETELFPFVFIHPGKTISVITASGKLLIPEAFPADTICSLDIKALRKAIFFTYNELTSFFSIMADGKYIFDVTLIPNQISEDVFFLKFRNSLGAYEIIEIAGNAEDETEFSEEESWLSLNNYNLFEEKRKRVFSKKSISAHAGYKSRNELSFILDVIKSDDIYFIDPNDEFGHEYPCFVTPEKTKISRRMIEPDSISLNIRPVSEDSFVSPEITLKEMGLIFENITAPGRPKISGDGFIYADDYAFHAE